MEEYNEVKIMGKGGEKSGISGFKPITSSFQPQTVST